MAASDGDLTCLQVSRLCYKLVNVPTPIADAYKERDTGLPRARWDRTEREHMSDWFYLNTTKGRGQYSRATPNASARTCYNRLLSHCGLIWIAEAFGLGAESVESAVKAAESVDDYRTKCREIRAVVPWERVYEHAIPLVRKYRIG